jgi:4-amino-4-deoxy-L-arabinose transferase-like glycosyltransferase
MRFVGERLAGQITWLVPLALVGAVAEAGRVRWRWPLAPAHAALLLWSGWLLTHWVVFTFAKGIFHEYYTTVMGPSVAALAGAGGVALWQAWDRGRWRRLGIFLGLGLTAAWQGYLVYRYPDFRTTLLPVIVGAAGAGLVGLLAAWVLPTRWGTALWGKLAAGVGLVAVLIAPATWSVAAVAAPGNPVMPAADPVALIGRRDRMPPGMPPGPPFGRDMPGAEKLVDFLEANRHGERILVAARSSMEVAPIIIRTGKPAVALGGFMGGDQVVTEEEFAELVHGGQVRFVLMGGPGGFGAFGPPTPPGTVLAPSLVDELNLTEEQKRQVKDLQKEVDDRLAEILTDEQKKEFQDMRRGFGPGGFGPGGPGNAEVFAWVRKHGKPVDAKLWQADEPPPAAGGGPGGRRPGARFGPPRGMNQLYDCRPELGLVVPDAR